MARDFQIFQALTRSPFSTEQLLALSRTFPQPFTSARPLRRRMQILTSAGWVRCWQYASTSRGAENYYKLTSAGYRLLNGPEAILPSRAFFQPVSLGLQQHTRALADFLVHTLVSAHAVGAELVSFHRENELKLTLGAQAIAPDSALRLRTSDGAVFNYFVEVDSSTEPVFSHRECESWERKLSFYDRYQDAQAERFRVVVLTTRSPRRHLAILSAAATLIRNPHRRLFYAAPLATYLAAPGGVLAPCFTDHAGEKHSLIPPQRQAASPRRKTPRMEVFAGVW
jgi:hypothetical protein